MKSHITKLVFSGIRIKRKIQPIPIENARPHNLTTREAIPTTASASYGVSDMQEFAQLVELEDDEVLLLLAQLKYFTKRMTLFVLHHIWQKTPDKLGI